MTNGTRPEVSWEGTYIFEYGKIYNEKGVKLKFTLDNGEKVEFKTILSQGKQVKNINELGLSSTSKGIEITAVVEEEENKLDMTLLNDLPKEILITSYGKSPNSEKNYFDGILTLTDADEKIKWKINF